MRMTSSPVPLDGSWHTLTATAIVPATYRSTRRRVRRVCLRLCLPLSLASAASVREPDFNPRSS